MISPIPLYICIPFGILLLAIAVMPLAFPKFWDKNSNKAILAAIISIPVFIYLIISFPHELISTFQDYASFIVLLAALFIISGGILMTGDLNATPKNNTIFLLIGAILANLIGTTGASMLLIRPMLKTNSDRKNIKHIPVFFIFLVSNIGGSLTPLGDPPLFLGFLKGVPFNFTFSLFPVWIFTVILLLAVFYFYDNYFYKQEKAEDLEKDKIDYKPIKIYGIINALFLIGVILLVFLQVPAPYREIGMILLSVLSMIFTKKEYRKEHNFTFNPIIEVAILFAGIFITMAPLVMLLHATGSALGVTKPWQFFWATGSLSSFLDNAPTYFTFFSLGESVTRGMNLINNPAVAGVSADILKAISAGAVFMGANTYIGNGPNFMVKTIAEEQGVKVPHFFGYMAYSGAILIPIFILVTFIFFV
jgi:Na+/H+ antiporter NhaD/arsenite permease-like protein